MACRLGLYPSFGGFGCRFGRNRSVMAEISDHGYNSIPPCQVHFIASYDKHAYRDGRLEVVVLRHLDAEDGNTFIAKDIRLSDFLSDLHL